jgi:hypothetical protein
LPPNSDLDESIEKTRQGFRRHTSAEGLDALPPNLIRTEAEAPEGDDDERISAGLHPFFRGLLDTLPDPGADWPRAQREQWLETARNIFALIYTDPGEEREPSRLADAQQHTARTEPQLDQRTG